METAVLLICYNRPVHTRMVLERILEAKPRDLYVFRDHPRGLTPVGKGTSQQHPDVEKCQQVIDVVNDLTERSGIHVHYLLPEMNLGCGPGPATGISWFFEHEEQGIIIEDDAVPGRDFFGYCEELLDRYKDDENIRAIGSMHLDNRLYGDGSYYFSMMNRTMCAWATWRRAWKDFNLRMKETRAEELEACLRAYQCDRRMRRFWIERLKEIQEKNYWYKSWDQQFWMSIWLHHGMGIMPNVNLSTNIGFDGSGVHCPVGSSYAANKPTQGILPLVHPSETVIQHSADRRFQRNYFDPKNYGRNWWRYMPYRLNRAVKKMVGHEGPWIK